MTVQPTPAPTASGTVHPSCPPSWACDTPDGSGLSAAGIFALVCVGLLLLAAATNKRRS